MLNVDLSTLRGQELRQLLDTTRRRGDAAVTYEILQEMAARRERGEPEQRRGLFGPRRPSESRVIELNLGDPLDPKEEVYDDEPAHSHPPADWELDALDAGGRDDARDDEDAIYLHPPAEPQFDDQPPPPKPRRRALWLSSGLAVGLVVGLALGGWAESVSRQGGGPLALAAAAPMPPNGNLSHAPAAAAAQPAVDPIAVETETAPATPLPQPPPPSAAAAPIPGAIAPAVSPAAVAPPIATPAPEAASTEVAEEAPAPDAVKPAVKAIAASTAQAGSKACAGQPTPADRAICETPRLQKLQKDLRQAYADALGAHQDRDLLREHQLAWREARNTVTEPERLAQLYEERIRKLKAATAEALRER